MASVCAAAEPVFIAKPGVWTGVERRQSERFRCNWYPTVGFLARADTLILGRGVIRDVSRIGLGLISQQFLEPDTIIAIQLRSKQNGFSDVLSAKVVRAEARDDGAYLLGCRLSRSLSNGEIEALLL